MTHWKTVCLILGLGALASCGGSRLTLRPATEAQLDQIRTGARPGEIRALFGEPHYVENVEFGEQTDEPWDGVVFVYLGQIDDDFLYATRYKSNRFAFALVAGDTLLNHWELDAVTDAAK